MKTSDVKQFITVTEGAVKIGVPERTLREWCLSGYVDSVRVGRSYLVDRKSLMKAKRPKRGPRFTLAKKSSRKNVVGNSNQKVRRPRP